MHVSWDGAQAPSLPGGTVLRGVSQADPTPSGPGALPSQPRPPRSRPTAQCRVPWPLGSSEEPSKGPSLPSPLTPPSPSPSPSPKLSQVEMRVEPILPY